MKVNSEVGRAKVTAQVRGVENSKQLKTTDVQGFATNSGAGEVGFSDAFFRPYCY